jgi:AcrR family transcriptional regulator
VQATETAATVDAGSDLILDAARATVLDFGVKRTTVSEVARRAGLSRMTVYRRYPDGAALIRALMTREFGALLTESLSSLDGAAPGRERIVTASVRTVERLMTHPLMLRLLELEPETLIPYLTERVGRFQQLARVATREAIVAGQSDGSVRAGDPSALAAACELAARGPVLAARSLAGPERDEALAELALMLDAYLRP